MNDILKYYGLDPSTVVKNNKPVTRDVTVRDLEKAINLANKLPSIVTIHDSTTDVKVITKDISTASTGTATASRNATITSSLVMNYSATGKYYRSGSTKYWTDALGSNIKIASDTSGAP